MTVAGAEAPVFYEQIHHIEYFCSDFGGLPDQGREAAGGWFGHPPMGDGGGTDVKLDYHSNSIPYTHGGSGAKFSQGGCGP